MQETVYIDLPPDELKNLELSQEVTVVLKGTIKSLRAADTQKEMEMYMSEAERKKKPKEKLKGSLTLKIGSLEVLEANEFSKIAKSEAV